LLVESGQLGVVASGSGGVSNGWRGRRGGGNLGSERQKGVAPLVVARGMGAERGGALVVSISREALKGQDHFPARGNDRENGGEVVLGEVAKAREVSVESARVGCEGSIREAN
jgi:hypothetical protein